MPELALDQFQGCSARAAGVPVIPLMRGRGWVAQPPTEVARDEAVQNAFYLVIYDSGSHTGGRCFVRPDFFLKDWASFVQTIRFFLT